MVGLLTLAVAHAGFYSIGERGRFIQQGELTLKKTIITLGSTTVLTAALFLSGCSSTEETKPVTPATTAPSASTAPAATPVVEAKPDAGTTLGKAKEHLTMAANELKNKNSKGAVEHIEMAHKSLTEASANAPAPVKMSLEAVGKLIDKAKPLAEKNDKGASAAIEAATSAIDKALPALKASSVGAAVGGALGAAAGMAKDAAGAAADHTKNAAGAVKDAAVAGADAAKDAAGKAMEKKDEKKH